MKITLKISIIAVAFSGLTGALLWAPPHLGRLSLLFYTFLFAFVPLATGALMCRSQGPDMPEWSQLGVIVLVFLFWGNLGVLIHGSAAQSIPIVVSNIAVTNLAASHPKLKVESAEEFRQAVYHFFSDVSRPRTKSGMMTLGLKLSPILLGFFVFMFFAYAGFKLARGEMMKTKIQFRQDENEKAV